MDWKKSLPTLLAGCLLIACQHGPEIRNEDMSTSTPKELSVTLSNLMPLLSQPRVSKEDQGTLLLHAKNLLTVIPKREIAAISPVDLRKQLEDSLQKLESGAFDEGARQLHRTTQSFINFYRFKDPKIFSLESGFNPNLDPLNAVERGHFHSMLQQFDLALLDYEEGLMDPKWNGSVDDWNLALQRVLTITVRERNNASLTMELLSRLGDAPHFPAKLKDDVRLWRYQAKQWRTEAKNHSKTEKPEEQIAEASQLIKTANSLKANQGLLLTLRASNLLNRALSEKLDATQKAEALYLSGLAAEALPNSNFWNFPEENYANCAEIEEVSDWKSKCTERLKLTMETYEKTAH